MEEKARKEAEAAKRAAEKAEAEAKAAAKRKEAEQARINALGMDA